MTTDAKAIVDALHEIRDALWWIAVWLFCLVVFKDMKGGSK